MKIADIMTRDVRLTNPSESVQDAAKRMAEEDVGLLPVGENDRLIGMITDRDIAVRVVAQGKPVDLTLVGDAMTDKVLYCYDDEDVEKVNESMERMKVRRIPIVDRSKRLVGIVSLSNLAASQGPERSGETLKSVAQPH